MKRRNVGILPLVLVVGAFGGVLGARYFTKADVVTRTVTATEDVGGAVQTLIVRVIVWPCGGIESPAFVDRFTLRSPNTNGLTQVGDVLEVADSVNPVGQRCDLEAVFPLSNPTDRIFVIVDEDRERSTGGLTQVLQWGPFSYRQAEANGWRLTLDATNPAGTGAAD